MTPRETRARRVLFVDHSAKLGDSEITLLDVAVALRDRGAVGLFEDGPFAAALVARNTAVLVLTSTRAKLTLPRVARSFAVLYANSPRAFLACAAIGLVARRPVVWHLRELLHAPHFSALHVRALVACANLRAARIVASSQRVADSFTSAGGRAALVRVIPDGVDATRFDRLGPEVRAAMRRELGISERAYLVGSFAEAASTERHVLDDALAQLPDVQAIVIDSPQSEHAGFPRRIAACDVVVHAGEVSAAAARVMMKVLMSRRPLVVTDAPGIGDLVENGVTGIVVAPRDPTALAAAISGLRAEPIRSDELAFNGSIEAHRRFSSEAMIASITQVIDEASSGYTP